MTIFPCSRCGGRPEILPGEATAVILRHRCPRGRSRETVFVGPSRDENTRDAIYIWNENNARDNPAWWPERCAAARATCRATCSCPARDVPYCHAKVKIQAAELLEEVAKRG